MLRQAALAISGNRANLLSTLGDVELEAEEDFAWSSDKFPSDAVKHLKLIVGRLEE